MYSVSIKTDKTWSDILASLQNKDDLLQRKMAIAMVQSVQLVRTNVLRSGLVPYKTGTLRRSITTAIIGTRVEDMRGFIGSNLPYAAVHEYGGSWTFHRHSAFGRETRPFSYTANYKARRYLRDPYKNSLSDVNKIFAKQLSSVVSFRKGK